VKRSSGLRGRTANEAMIECASVRALLSVASRIVPASGTIEQQLTVNEVGQLAADVAFTCACSGPLVGVSDIL
jgi:hypothetical protein